jgi:hypothetical protein
MHSRLSDSNVAKCVAIRKANAGKPIERDLG